MIDEKKYVPPTHRIIVWNSDRSLILDVVEGSFKVMKWFYRKWNRKNVQEMLYKTTNIHIDFIKIQTDNDFLKSRED